MRAFFFGRRQEGRPGGKEMSMTGREIENDKEEIKPNWSGTDLKIK